MWEQIARYVVGGRFIYDICNNHLPPCLVEEGDDGPPIWSIVLIIWWVSSFMLGVAATQMIGFFLESVGLQGFCIWVGEYLWRSLVAWQAVSILLASMFIWLVGRKS